MYSSGEKYFVYLYKLCRVLKMIVRLEVAIAEFETAKDEEARQNARAAAKKVVGDAQKAAARIRSKVKGRPQWFPGRIRGVRLVKDGVDWPIEFTPESLAARPRRARMVR